MLAMLFVSTTVWAQSSLTVGGVSVNLSATTEQTITGSSITGTVTYNPSSKTLYLKNATIKGSIQGKNLGTYPNGDRYFIHLTGSNTIESSYSGMRFDDCYMVLYGAAGSMLYINTSTSTADYACIDIERSHFDVWAIRLIMSGKTMGFWGNPNSGTLSFINSMVSINCDGSAIEKCKNVYFDDCKCTTNGATFKSGTGYVNSSGSLLTSLTIWPLLTVGNEPVRTEKDYEYGSLYSWKWSKNTKTLEITGDVSANTYRGIENYGIDGLTIKCDGSYKVESNWEGLTAHTNTNLSGSGTLILNGTNTSSGYGIRAYDSAKITVSTNELQATGGAYGMYTPGTLTLKKNSDNTVHKFLGSVYNLRAGSLDLSNMDVWTSNTYFNPTDHKLYYNGAEASSSNGAASGTWFKSKSQFTYYPVYVAGVQVNHRNCDNITSQYITGGKASYDNSTKTLTLDNIQIDVTATSDAAVKTTTAAGDFTLKFTGTDEAHLNSKSASIDLSSNTTITGTSNVVRVESTNGSGIVTRSTPSYVTIDVHGYFGSKGKNYGYYGENSETLTLKKETSDMYGFSFEGEEGALHAVKNLVLDNMDYGWAGNNGYYFADGDVRQNGGAIVKGLVEFGSIQEKLPIYICGKQLNKVTSNTGYTIYVGSPYISSGTKSVGYNPFTKTLTLNNAKITNDNPATSGHGAHAIDIDPGFEGTIKLIGANSIIDPHFSAVVHEGEATTTFAGEGSLYVKGNVFALMPWRGTMIFSDNVTVEAEATSTAGYGIGSNNTGTAGETIVIKDNAVVKTSSIGGLNTITLNDGQSIVEPAGAEIKNLSSGWAVCVGENVAKDVLIMKVEDYGLEVCDVAVNSYNYADPHRDGKFKYDNEAKTLTITGANIDDTSIKNVVTNINVDGLKVNFVGDNSFKVNENIFQLLKSTTITGTGTVTGELAAEDGFGIWYKADLDITLDGATFQFKGFKGVSGFYDATVNMTINSGKFIFEPTSATGLALEGLASLTLGTGMEFAEPVGGRYDTVLEAVTVDGTSPYNGKVVIEGATAYDLWIAEKAVNSVNCKDILGDGVFAYDAASNTLTIKGNHTYTGDDYLVISTIADLTINVAGNSMLVSAADQTIIRLKASTTITGGKLTLMCTAPSNDGLGIYISDGGVLTLKDADIDVTGDGFTYGITGDSSSKLVIDNSNISASAHSYGAIYDWGGITLTNCYVETPRPSTIDDMGIADADGYVGSGDETATVVIKAGADAIDGIEAAETAPAEIYDVAGRKLDQTRRGINIVRSKNGKAVKVMRK